MPRSGFGQTFPVGSTKAYFARITDLSSAASLPKATSGRTAIFQAEGQPVRWRPDGTDPDSTTGMLLGVSKSVKYTGDLTKLRFIQTAVSATLSVTILK